MSLRLRGELDSLPEDVTGSVQRNGSRFRKTVAPLRPFLVLLILWQILTSAHVVGSLILPSPLSVARRFLVVAGPSTAWHLEDQILVSIYRVAVGSAIGASSGLAFGLLLGASRSIRRTSWWLIVVLMSIPALAWVPIFLLSLGRGSATAVVVVAIGVTFPVLMNTMGGVLGIPREYGWALYSLGGRRRDILVRVFVPAALPFIATGVRIGLAQGWRTLVAAEMLATTSGIGYSIFAARQYMNTSDMYIGIATLAILGFATEHFVSRPLVSLSARSRGRTGQRSEG